MAARSPALAAALADPMAEHLAQRFPPRRTAFLRIARLAAFLAVGIGPLLLAVPVPELAILLSGFVFLLLIIDAEEIRGFLSLLPGFSNRFSRKAESTTFAEAIRFGHPQQVQHWRLIPLDGLRAAALLTQQPFFRGAAPASMFFRYHIALSLLLVLLQLFPSGNAGMAVGALVVQALFFLLAARPLEGAALAARASDLLRMHHGWQARELHSTFQPRMSLLTAALVLVPGVLYLTNLVALILVLATPGAGAVGWYLGTAAGMAALCWATQGIVERAAAREYELQHARFLETWRGLDGLLARAAED